MSPAKIRSRRKRFKSRKQKGPKADVTPNEAEGEKEEREGGRRQGRRVGGREGEGRKKLFSVYCVLSPSQEFPLAGTSFNHLSNTGVTYYSSYFI